MIGPISMGFFVLIACQLLGEILRRLLALPIPGPVIGMLLLAAALVLLRGRGPAPPQSEPSLERTATFLVGNMGLLFVPAGVGVIAELGLIRAAWLPLLVGLVGSTLAGLVVTGLVMDGATKLTEGRGKSTEGRGRRPS
jgi:putative effector of murein hydrolase LrgA (UPF0299 family)